MSNELVSKHPKAQLETPQPDAAFYISATAPPTRRQRTLKHNDSFVVLDHHGDIGLQPGTSDGFFNRDTRYLSRLTLSISGGQPLFLGSDIRDDNLNLFVDLTNPDLRTSEGIVLQKDTAHIARTVFVRDDMMRERIEITNHGRSTLDLKLRMTFDADFADVFEVRGTRRSRRGSVSRRLYGSHSVMLDYVGTDEVARRTTILFEPDPASLDVDEATYDVLLEPGNAATIFVRVQAGLRELPRFSFASDLAGARRELKAVVNDIATVETSNDVVNEILHRSRCDLYMLVTATEQGPYPYAGTPWYSTTFGRDGLITALQMLWFDPRIARGVLARLAHYQATELDPEADAEPGKILHEMRAGEMAACREIPFGLYYGSVDSTPLFVILAGRYLQRTGDMELIRRLWPAIERALDWMDRWGDRDGDGLIEYTAQSDGSGGLTNQGWKDSVDSVFHADGELARGSIALVEVQGYAYLARCLAAHCAARLGLDDTARHLSDLAAQQRRRFEDAFWCEELQTYAIALDGDKRACRVRTSNAGQAMFSGIMRPDRARCVAADLGRPHFQSGWGVRTVAADAIRYNPMSYHNGSVWPHDNAMIAAGFARYGLHRDAEPIFRGIMDAARYMEHRRLPELFCGFHRRPGRGPTLYPVACAPQAWAAGAPFQFLEAFLGLQFDAPSNSILLQDPVVPRFLDAITVRNLRLGAGRADFRIVRHKHGVALEAIRISGDLRISLSHQRRIETMA